MSIAFDPATTDALAAGRTVERGMLLLDLGSGLYGFWTGLGPFTYGGVTYVGAGSLIQVENVKQASDGSAVPVVARLTAIENSSLSPDILATIESEVYHQRPVTIMTAYFDPESYALLSVETEYRGYIDQILHTESTDGQAVLEGHFESRFRDHQKTGYRMRSDADQRLIDANDDGMTHVTAVANEDVLFGRSPNPPIPPKKKSKFLGIF